MLSCIAVLVLSYGGGYILGLSYESYVVGLAIV